MLLPLFLINPIQLKILVRDTGHHSAVEHLPSMREALGSLPSISYTHTHTKILVRINFFIGILRNKQTKTECFKFYIQSLYLGIKKKIATQKSPWTRKILGISQTVTCLLGMQKLISEMTRFFVNSSSLKLGHISFFKTLNYSQIPCF